MDAELVVGIVLCVLCIRRTLVSSSQRGPGPLSSNAVVKEETIGQGTYAIGVLSGGIVWLFTNNPLVAATFFVATILMAPHIRRRATARRVSSRFRVELPAFVEEFARGLRGGLSPSQALVEGAFGAGPPFPQVFAPAASMLHIGATSSEAVTAWAVARDDSSLRFLATAIAVGEAVGGIDGRSADAVAVALRDRSTMEAIVRVQATQALYSAAVLCGAPVVFCSLVVLSDQRSSAFLLRNPIGIALGLGGLTLDACGAIWMRHLVRKVVR